MKGEAASRPARLDGLVAARADALNKSKGTEKTPLRREQERGHRRALRDSGKQRRDREPMRRGWGCSDQPIGNRNGPPSHLLSHEPHPLPRRGRPGRHRPRPCLKGPCFQVDRRSGQSFIHLYARRSTQLKNIEGWILQSKRANGRRRPPASARPRNNPGTAPELRPGTRVSPRVPTSLNVFNSLMVGAAGFEPAT